MKRALVLGFVGVLLVCAPGCGGNDPDSLFKAMISDMNAVAEALEKKESPDKIKAAAEKYKKSADKLSALKLSEEEQKKLLEKHGKDMLGAAFRLAAAESANPEGAAGIKDLLKDAMK